MKGAAFVAVMALAGTGCGAWPSTSVFIPWATFPTGGATISDPPRTMVLTEAGKYRLSWSAAGCERSDGHYLTVGMVVNSEGQPAYWSPGSSDPASLPKGEITLTDVPAGTAMLVMSGDSVPGCKPAVRLEKVAP